MVKKMTVRSHTGPDGSLKIQVPTEVPETDVDVEIVIRSVGPDGRGPETEANGWPEGFLERMFGSLAGMGLERHPQGDYEERDPLL